MSPTRRRASLRDPELDARLDALVDEAERAYGTFEDRELVRELLVAALRMMQEQAPRGDLKLVTAAIRELRHAFSVFRPYEQRRKVAIWGSARTGPDHPDWQQAHDFAAEMTAAGWMSITGAGDGVMGAAQAGAGREASFGVNIRLPFEQRANETIAGDPKLMHFRYFFTRKVMFVKEAHALALFPGGFGTHDEGFEVLTLIQTGKSELLPVVFVDSPGGSYWRDWQRFVKEHMLGTGLIGPEDLSLFKVTDQVGEAVREILKFYANYHSSRYVDELLVLRVRQAPDADELERLQRDFKDILVDGEIEVRRALPREGNDVPELPRVVFHFDRRAVGRLRMLVDRLNALVPQAASPPGEASPHQILESPIGPTAEQAEQDDR